MVSDSNFPCMRFILNSYHGINLSRPIKHIWSTNHKILGSKALNDGMNCTTRLQIYNKKTYVEDRSKLIT